MDNKLKAGYIRWIYKVISGGYQSFLSRVAHQCRSQLPFGVSSVAQLSQVSAYRRRRQLTVKNRFYFEVPHTYCHKCHHSGEGAAQKTINTLHNITDQKYIGQYKCATISCHIMQCKMSWHKMKNMTISSTSCTAVKYLSTKPYWVAQTSITLLR